MLKFAIQTDILGEITQDFAFFLKQAGEYHRWYSGSIMELKYVRAVETFKIEQKVNPDLKLEDYIPIGSTTFVCQWLKDTYGIEPKPINIPFELSRSKYLKRKIICRENYNLKQPGEYFIKDITQFKGIAEVIEVKDKPRFLEGKWMISEVLEIDSEWRVFVFRDKIVGAKNYLGDEFTVPDKKLIEEMIVDYKGPVAYTLDVGINKDGTFLIEVHDFFSCGLYGLDRSDILPFMYSQWYKEFLRKNR